MALEGVAELTKRLNALGDRLSTKALRTAVRRAVAPVVRQMRAAAPVGTEAHRTYKRRLVAPSFLKRSIRVITKIDRAAGTASAVIGTRKEAWYGVRLYDQGPTTISQRRVAARGPGRRRRATRAIKPYTLRRVPFFQSVFVSNRAAMEADLAANLKAELEKLGRGN